VDITFGIKYAFGPGSDSVDNARALKALLEGLILLNRAYLIGHPAPNLYTSGVVYDRTTIWDTIPDLLHRGYGDCKSLSAYQIAMYRHRGIEALPVFRFFTNPDGSTDYHILVQTANGYECPSRVLGMGRNENQKPRF
jgi:hypothetical protein